VQQNDINFYNIWHFNNNFNKCIYQLPRSLSENRKPTPKNLDLVIFPSNYRQIYIYSTQIREKSVSNQLSLATIPVLGQAPS